MSSESYSQLLGGMWAPAGSDINAKLQKLQELERMRKEREMQRKMKQSGTAITTVGTTRGVRSRLRSNQSDTENDPTAYITKQFESEMENTFGGARPKSSNSRDEPVRDPTEDWDQMFQTVTGRLLNKPTTDNQSSFRRDRYGRSDLEEQSSGRGSRLRSSYRTYDRPRYTSRYNRSNSQPEEQGDDIFSGVTDSILGRAEDGPFDSINSYEPRSYARRRYERENEEMIGTEGEEQQVENGEHQMEEVIEILDDDENEEPVHFIERLKKGHDSDDNNNEFNFNQKRGVNGFLSTNLPTVPPLKKLKPGETDVTNEDEQYDDVTKYIHPVEDIVAVAKDINAAFGSKSPKSGDAIEQDNNETETNFSFKSSWMAEKDRLNADGDFVFTASTPDPSVVKQRTSGSKRKQRSSTKGRCNTYDSSPKTVEDVDNNVDEANDTNTSVVYYEDVVFPEDSYLEEQQDLAADTEDLYKSRFSTYMDLNQTPGQLDEIQEFFSGKEVRGDPVIRHVLHGDVVEKEMTKYYDDVSPGERRRKREEKKREEEKQSKMSLEERLTKLKTMTEEKSKRQSTKASENRQEELGNRQSRTPNKDLSLNLKTENKKSASPDTLSKHSPRDQRRSSESKLSPRDQRKDSEVKKSPRGDLMNNVRELKKFIHESVSEPATPVLETQRSIERRPVKEISTQTDSSELVYICKHCGKSSSDKVVSEKKPETVSKTTKLDLRLETKNPSQNYAELEQSHLAGIKKEMKGSNKSLADSDSKKTMAAPIKLKTATNTPSYMKSTASSNKKTSNGIADKTARKGSAPDINKVKELQRTKSPVGFLKGGKNIVAQRAKAFDGTNTKTSGKDKAKPGLSLYRGKSAERQKKDDKSSKGENTASTMSKSKSCEQMSMFSDDKTVNRKDESSKKLVKQKSVDDKLEQSEKTVESNAAPSPGTKRTRAQMIHKGPPPPLSPKPVRMVESGPPPLSPKPVRMVESGPPPLSPKPVRMIETGPLLSAKPALSPKPVRTIESGLISPIVVSPLRSKESKPPAGGHTGSDGGKPEPEDIHSSRRVETEGQFTTLRDNPFIKSDSKRRNSLRGRKQGESVWEREKSRSRESLKRSNTSAGERSSLSHLSWSDSGSTDSLPASISGLQRSVSDRRGSVTSITSQSSVLNLLDPKGTKTDIVTGMKETNVDEAYEEYISSRNNSVTDENADGNLNDSGLLDFAQQACSLLEFESKKRDSSSDSTETEGKVTSDPGGKSKDQVTVNGTSHLKNGVVDSSTTTTDKAGKKTKQKKGFFKGRLFNK